MNFFDGKYPSWLKPLVIKPIMGKIEKVELEKVKDTVSLTKMNILTNIATKIDDTVQDESRVKVYMEFTCPEQYPYISISKS